MRRVLLACPLLLAFVPFGFARPVEGQRYLEGRRIGARGSITLLHQFAGGERACVIAIGDHRPVVPLKITVYDDQENVVAQDAGTEVSIGERPGTADYVAAIWYPPRDMNCRIVVESDGAEYNDVAISLK